MEGDVASGAFRKAPNLENLLELFKSERLFDRFLFSEGDILNVYQLGSR